MLRLQCAALRGQLAPPATTPLSGIESGVGPTLNLPPRRAPPPGPLTPCHRYTAGNDHGFGSHCYSWEFASQAPWCYVSDECKVAEVKGSFGRKFEECTSSYEFDDYGYPYPE